VLSVVLRFPDVITFLVSSNSIYKQHHKFVSTDIPTKLNNRLSLWHGVFTNYSLDWLPIFGKVNVRFTF